MEDERETSSLKQRIRKSSMNLSCCFHGQRFDGLESPSPDHKHSPMRSPMRSPSSWLRSKGHEFPEIRGKCKSLINRIGRHRRHSADFSYDPLSYALNFDAGEAEDVRDEELPVRNFSARLPSSPPNFKADLRSFEIPVPRGRTGAPPTARAKPAIRSVTPPPRVETLRSIDLTTGRTRSGRTVTQSPPRSRTEPETEKSVTPDTAAAMSRREIVAFS